jgi:hypothetical protein
VEEVRKDVRTKVADGVGRKMKQKEGYRQKSRRTKVPARRTMKWKGKNEPDAGRRKMGRKDKSRLTMLVVRQLERNVREN